MGVEEQKREEVGEEGEWVWLTYLPASEQ